MGWFSLSQMSSRLQKFRLHRNILIVASVLCIVFAVVIIFENIIFCNRNCFAMVFTYLLAWMFFTCGLIGLKMSFLLRSCDGVKSTGQLRRISPAPIWISDPQILETPQLPLGFVPASQFPPPPPAYSRINIPVDCLPIRISSAPPAYDRVCRSVYPQQLCFETIDT